MQIKLKKFEFQNKESWDQFVYESNNGTLFHRLDFLGYHEENKFHTHHIAIYNNNELVGVLPLALFCENGRLIAKSPYGASWGGLVIHNLRFKEVASVIGSLMEYFNSLNISEIFIVPSPLHYYRQPSCYIEFVLLKNGFTLRNRDITSVISLDYEGDDPFITFQSEARTATRKAQKIGVTIRESEDYKSFYDILLENHKLHGAQPTHSLDELLKLKKFCRASLKLDMAFFQDTPIGGILYFLCNIQTILAFYICRSPGFEKYRPINLLLYEGIRWAKKNRYRFLDLGTTTINMIPRMNLFDFKEKFGTRGYFRETYHWAKE